MGLRKYFKTSSSKKNKTAVLDERMLICIESRNTDTMSALSDAIIKWKRYLKYKPQIKPWALYKEYSGSHEILWFTPYSAELFFKFFKDLIINHFPVPNTGGNTFHNTSVNVYLFYNTFSDTKVTKSGRPVLDTCKKVGTYKDCDVLNDRFTSILLTIFSLIFYKKYSPEYFRRSGEDAGQTYEGCVNLASFFEKVYLSEHRLPKAQLATMPTDNQFQAGNDSGIYIPAFSNQSITLSSVSNSNKATKRASASQSSSTKAKSSSASTESSSSKEPTKSSSQITKSPNSTHNKMISLKEFRNNYFPMTSRPEVLEQGIQMLLDERPDLFKLPVHFQKFHVDKAKQAPASLDDALRTGRLDNQRYVIAADNQFRRVANEILMGRQNALELKATRASIALIAGAYEKISNRISALLDNANDNKPLTIHSKKYYDKYYRNGVARQNKDEKVELDTMKKAYHQAYESKWNREKAKIISKYNKRRQNLSDNINKDSGVLFIKGRGQRNHEAHVQADSIKDIDLKKLGAELRKYQVHIGHKMASDNKAVFEYLNYEYSAQHERAKETVSELIKKQVQLNQSRINLKQAQAEVKSTKGNNHLNKQLQKEQKDEAKYISQLKQECSNLRIKAKKYSTDSSHIRTKLTNVLKQSKKWQDELNNIKIQKKATSQLKKQNQLNKQRYRKEYSKNQKQKSAFVNLQSSMSAQNKQATSKASSMSVSASNSASIVISQNDTDTYLKKNSLMATIRNLKAQSASASSNTSDISKNTSTEAQLNRAYNSLHTFKVSVSTSDSIRQSIASSNQSQAVTTRNSYQAVIKGLRSALSRAGSSNIDMNEVKSYSKAVNGYGMMQASLNSMSVSMSHSTSNRVQGYESIISSLNQKLKAPSSNKVSPAVQQSFASQSNELKEARQALATLKSSFKSTQATQSANNKPTASWKLAQSNIAKSVESDINQSLKNKKNHVSANNIQSNQTQQPEVPNYAEPWAASTVNPRYQQFSIQGDIAEKRRMERQQMLDKTNRRYKQYSSKRIKPTHNLPWEN